MEKVESARKVLTRAMKQRDLDINKEATKTPAKKLEVQVPILIWKL